MLGSPPRDLSGETNASLLSFPAHTAHVTERSHPAYDCSHCHAKPADILSPGHVFDDSPGRAEVNFQAGLSTQGAYDGAACSSLYCHGNGRGANGTYPRAGPATTCQSCHPDGTSGSAAWRTMSPGHDKHLRKGISCYECHGGVVSTLGNAIQAPTLHVNGRPEVSFPTSSIVYASARCSGVCHGEVHSSRRW
jgi:predicted CxxxxCH...CXXCH cytochrome family protein